ncbi:hypothetical protein ADUPG1_011748 [Aduncisulcus paluster]|uniref:MARVEL domain-containing protein n=1 Tax=Aduncisulcus paluster TaxID=2918883 RepID=A0ABQ5JZA7_9EUKA|nr:hypothetical protein ADUPG1_011748 [Aduncisulcus paluster]|eukprot:gnl/Carplike_NY0171/1907_a2583_656.p1 GENE.gnl/Carplike_NY0171/1907_a2583_656~~gnl/Carplike_NY0171/1907_a2583_656.p1  ORF type:complete len:306 (+),score=40.78 gnl/Carplike_NY0171/1907_a2583_656:62-979(+)
MSQEENSDEFDGGSDKPIVIKGGLRSIAISLEDLDHVFESDYSYQYSEEEEEKEKEDTASDIDFPKFPPVSPSTLPLEKNPLSKGLRQSNTRQTPDRELSDPIIYPQQVSPHVARADSLNTISNDSNVTGPSLPGQKGMKETKNPAIEIGGFCIYFILLMFSLGCFLPYYLNTGQDDVMHMKSYSYLMVGGLASLFITTLSGILCQLFHAECPLIFTRFIHSVLALILFSSVAWLEVDLANLYLDHDMVEQVKSYKGGSLFLFAFFAITIFFMLIIGILTVFVTIFVIKYAVELRKYSQAQENSL